MLGTSSPPVRSIAWRIARANALNAASALTVEIVHQYLAPQQTNRDTLVMVVLPAEHVDVQCHAGGDGERVEDVREHLRSEVPDLLALQLQVRHAVRARADVDDRPRQRLPNARYRVS